ncbi:NADPH-dependent FMN reductase [Sinomonas atrocyanea]|uniref:NADPH-dependent FMN reductase n=1 Tax=Sinomonas atrocyanea TaxID=37927 RepID=A0A127A5E5_9MICC|nr:FMN reductase [Sinomonas atrocyanea]AMM34690.1 NADPH-dependent FMN reductase [Sinomonas atrocyanea]GEB64094.1 oxidoreductase [Sinomonas atrocyanea]GGG67582.1 oxidoreductase [Sinomonas atrocyanea]
MAASTSIVVISAGLGVPSSSRLLADQISVAVERLGRATGLDPAVTVLELRDLAVDIANNFVTGYAAPDLAEAIAAVGGADAIVAVTPVFSASYSGLFKSFIDVLEPRSLEGKPVLLGATGGTARHSLVLDLAMRPLFSYLRTRTVPTGVFAAPTDWGKGTDGGQAAGLTARIERAATELVRELAAARPAAAGAPGAQALPSVATRPEDKSFEELLADLTAPRR